MNYPMIFYLLGWVLNFQGALMVLPSVVALAYGENTIWDFLLVMAICFVIGIPLTRRRPKNDVIYAREGFVAVSLSWIMLSLFGSLPFVISGEIPSFVDALFETVSGYTTTGASILADVEALSKSLLFWRSFTHWVGGMGVLVLMLAILPLGGGHNFHLMRAESPGPSVSKLVPKLRQTALILYAIYLVMTVVQIVLLLFAKMPLFDALCIAFGSAGTGGFGVKNDSMASYTGAAQVITAVFTMLFGINFSIYYLFLIKKPKAALKSEELRAYLGVILVATVVILLNVRRLFPTFGETLKQAFFQVSSIITTTGFSTTDFNLWPALSKSMLLLLMFIGASAGSTGGGLKVSRVVILAKTMLRELFRLVHPRGVKKVTFEGRALSDENTRSVGVYLATYAVIFGLSVLLVSVDNFDMTTNITAVTAAFNNIGPGLEAVGPASNFGGFSIFSKCILIFDMLAGRLELFPLLVLLTPATWKK